MLTQQEREFMDKMVNVLVMSTGKRKPTAGCFAIINTHAVGVPRIGIGNDLEQFTAALTYLHQKRRWRFVQCLGDTHTLLFEKVKA